MLINRFKTVSTECIVAVFSPKRVTFLDNIMMDRKFIFVLCILNMVVDSSEGLPLKHGKFLSIYSWTSEKKDVVIRLFFSMCNFLMSHMQFNFWFV